MPILRGYTVGVAIRQSAASAPGTLVWSLLNGDSKKTLYIRRITMNVIFDGAAGASTAVYFLARYRGGIPTGGAGVVAGKRDDSTVSFAGAVGIAVIRQLDSGLGVGGTTPDAAQLLTMAVPRGTTGGSCYYNFEWPTKPDEGAGDGLDLAPGIGFGLYLGATSVIGDGLVGSIEWDEQPQRPQY
jgi:hypothetical protein